MTVKELANKYRDYIVAQRRHFHQYPELSFEEMETTRAIVRELENIDGMEIRKFDGYEGCVGILHGVGAGKVLVLRADIDALSVREETGLSFASRNEGIMHACGHDCHIAMQLGAAKILSELKDRWCGVVKFFFQPVEERCEGAKMAIREGLLEDVDAAYATHVWAGLDSPKVNFERGERMASADTFVLTVKGSAAHNAVPHLGSNTIAASAAVIMNLQSICSCSNDPNNTLVITIGTFDGGQKGRIIADKVELSGTARTFSRDFRETIADRIRTLAEHTAACYGCSVELDYVNYAIPSVNEDEGLVRTAQDAATGLYGADILAKMEKVTAGEDFSFFMEKVPGVLGFIGTRSANVPGSEYPNHHERFTVDEDTLHRGAAVAAQFALNFLSGR